MKDLKEMMSRWFTIGFSVVIALIYLVLNLFPTANPVILVKQLGEMTWSSPWSEMSWKIPNALLTIILPVSAICIFVFAQYIRDLFHGNKMAKTLAICLTASMVILPILAGLGSDLFTKPVGIIISLTASLFVGVIFWIIFLLISIAASKFGAKGIFAEVKDNFVSAVEAERDKAPTK